MGWARKPVPAARPQQASTLVGVDLNTTRARAVAGPPRALPRVLPLEGSQEELPMVLSLEGRRLEVGRPGAALCRLSPHLTCLDFLAYLGESREWSAGRHRVDAVKASTLVLERLQTACAGSEGIVLALPPYLTRPQAALLTPLAEKARLPLLGSVRGPLAAALSAYAAEPWSGLALVLDADDHALTASTVIADDEQLWLHAMQSWPNLNLRAWKTSLLDKVADRCIRQSRRDPRDSASAEQSLYEQLQTALDASGKTKMVELFVQTAQWCQNLFLPTEEIVTFCASLVRQTIDSLGAMLASVAAHDSVRRVFLTRAVEQLPGLAVALETYVRVVPPSAEPETEEPEVASDFGEDLLDTETDPEPSRDFGEGLLQTDGAPAHIAALGPDAVARGAHELAGRFLRGELARGFFDISLPLPKSPEVQTGKSGKRGFRLFGAESGHEGPSAG